MYRPLSALCVVLLLFVTTSVSAFEPNNLSPSSEKRFVENVGQITDQYQNTRNDIDVKFSANGVNIFIGSGVIHYQYSRPINKSQQDDELMLQQYDCKMYRMDVVLEGANEKVQPILQGKSSDYDRYYTSNLNGAVSYGYQRVTYKNIYPNIDWVLYINDDQLKHEFVVHEGGNIADIQIRYKGATDLQLNADGSLSATTFEGIITEHAPLSYTANDEIVASAFILNGDVLSYHIGDYTGKLTIDPTLMWSTYYGGTDLDRVSEVSADASGNSAFCGLTQSTSNIATVGAHDVTFSNAKSDGFIVCFNPNGTRKWGTYYGNNGDEIAEGVQMGVGGNVYVVGRTSSTSGFIQNAFQSNMGSPADAYIAKFNSNGQRVWGTYYGGNGTEYCSGIMEDGGYIYIVGATGSNDTNTVATAPPYNNGAEDAFIAKFDTSGHRIWGRTWGGNGWDQAYSLTMLPSNKIAVVGQTQSTTGPVATTGVHQTTYGGLGDGFITIYDTAGNRLKSTYFGGTGEEYIFDVIGDASGNVYVVGSSGSQNSIVTTGSYNGGSKDGFIARFDTSLQRTWCRYVGGSSSESLRGIGITGSGDSLLFGGWTRSSGISTTGSYNGGATDGVIGKVSASNGASAWIEYYGSDGGEIVHHMEYQNGELYLVGTTGSRNFPVKNAHQDSLSPFSDDGFVVKMCEGLSAGLVTGSNTVCVGRQEVLSAQVAGGTWFASGDASVNATGTVTGNAIGNATIYYAITNSCGSDTTRYMMNVLDTPTVTAQPRDTTVTISNAAEFTVSASGTGTITYQWQEDSGSGFADLSNGGQYSGVNTNKLTVSLPQATNNNNKYRCIIKIGDCESISNQATLNVVVSVGNITQSEVSVYPNPVSYELYIEYKGISRIALYDITGRLLQSNHYHKVDKTSIDMQEYSTGIYMLEVNDNNVIRIVKE